MDLSVLANINDSIAKNEFLKAQQQKLNSWYEPDSPLNKAQAISNSYMMAKQRKPMVIEYFSEKGKMASIEMYINPDGLSFQAQKVVSKQITRGGIFYHHWGDDHPTLQLSGTTGYSFMKGIEQLEKIYHYSGTLLRYKNVGPDVVNNGEQSDYNVISYSDPLDSIDYIIRDMPDEKGISNIKSKMPNSNLEYENSNAKLANSILDSYCNSVGLAKNSAKYNSIYIDLNNFINKSSKYNGFKEIYQEAQRLINNSFPSYHHDLKTDMAYDLAYMLNNAKENKTYNSNLQNITHKISQQKMNKLTKVLSEIQEFKEKSKISYEEIKNGILDIQDELEDEWRPRQLFIYFEDRVYIGHFTNFSYQRVAAQPLIKYDMRFNIIRQIILTSNSPDRKKPGTTSNGNRVDKPNIPVQDNNNDIYDMIRKEALKGNLIPAQKLIGQIKCSWRFEKAIIMNGGDISKLRQHKGDNYYIEAINKVHSAVKINGVQLIGDIDPKFGDDPFTPDIFLEYMSYATNKKFDINEFIDLEYTRIRMVVDRDWAKADKKRKHDIHGWTYKFANATQSTNHKDFIYLSKIFDCC